MTVETIINLDQLIGIMIAVAGIVISPLIVFTLKQKSKVEKLETLRDTDRKDFDEHMKHSELQQEILNKISETVSVYKWMLERIERDISELKSKIDINGFKRSAV